MTNSMGFDIQFLQLRSRHVAKRDDFVTRKKIEESFEHRQASRSLGLVRHAIAQHAAAWIERMPRERIPQDELLRLYFESEQCAPDDSCCRLRKSFRTIPRFTGAARLDTGKNVFGFNAVISLSPEQDSLGGHGDAAEMSAAITERFTNRDELYLAEPFSKISG